MSNDRSKIVAILIGGTICLGAIVGFSYFQRKRSEVKQPPAAPSEDNNLEPAMEETKPSSDEQEDQQTTSVDWIKSESRKFLKNILFDILITDVKGISVYNGSIDRELVHHPLPEDSSDALNILCGEEDPETKTITITTYKKGCAVSISCLTEDFTNSMLDKVIEKLITSLALVTSLSASEKKDIGVIIKNQYFIIPEGV